MIRNKKVETRFSEEELLYIDNKRGNSMNRSEYIRQCINGGNSIDVKGIAQSICNIQNVVNKINSVGATQEDWTMLTSEVNTLWLYLN